MSRTGASFGFARPGWRAIVALVLATVVIGMLLVARLRGGVEQGGAAREPGAGSVGSSAEAQSPASPSSLVDHVEGPEELPAAQQAPPAALTVAEAFVRAWATHPAGTTPAAWWAAVSQHSDAVLREQLRTVDPERVPATAVTGPPTGISGGVTNATVAVPTDAGTVVLTCIQLDGRWLVSDLDLERAAP